MPRNTSKTKPRLYEKLGIVEAGSLAWGTRNYISCPHMSDPSSSNSDAPKNQASPTGGKRRKFLVILDGTPESEVALHFASRRAKHTGGGVTLLAILEKSSFQHWLGVDALMKEEARQEAETFLHKQAARVNEIAGVVPELVIREGKKIEQIQTLLAEDAALSIMILGAGSGRDGPGPLVAMIAGGADGGFAIPVTIVPGTLSEEEIHDLA